MSNRKIREQLGAKQYKAYKSIENPLLNYQLCKSYFNDQSASIIGVAELALKSKYNLPWQSKLIRKALMGVRGKSNPLVAIPQFNYSEKLYDILSKFVKRNFTKILADQKVNRKYPLEFKNFVERYS
jgi:hypothetical protein